MFFEQENIGFMILDVMGLNYGKAMTYNADRNYHALSFRFKANTEIEYFSDKDKRGYSYHLTDNSLAYFPANTPYTRRAEYDRMIVIHFSCFGYEYKDIEYFYPKEPLCYAENFKKILEIWQGREPSYKMRAASVLYEILADAHAENRPTITRNPLINDSVEYMLNNFSDPNISVAYLAKTAHISEAYFRRLFKAEYNTSPKKYISKLRIKYASELIATGYYSLPQVAEMSGFSDYRYFSVEFKRHMGCSPSKYRYVGVPFER